MDRSEKRRKPIRLGQILNNRNVSCREIEIATGISRKTIARLCGDESNGYIDSYAAVLEYLGCSLAEGFAAPNEVVLKFEDETPGQDFAQGNIGEDKAPYFSVLDDQSKADFLMKLYKLLPEDEKRAFKSMLRQLEGDNADIKLR